MRNPLTNLIQKRSRRSIIRKQRSTFSSTSSERVCSNIIINYAVMFIKISILFAVYFARALALNDINKVRDNLHCLAFRLQVVNTLVYAESALGDTNIDSIYCLYSIPL